ncbi:hypothetical protein NIB75_28655 [Bacteroides uniformis]|nr:hypothetical protein [Bacteroides uniformis]
MVYLYGDVPYVDKIQDQFRIDFTRTPKEEVIAHMVEDLQFAVENLPTDPRCRKSRQADQMGGRTLTK